MNKLIHRNNAFFGRTHTIILADGNAYAMVTIMDTNKSVAILHDLTVYKDKRGEGLGSAVLEEACDEAGRMGADAVWLSVEPNSWLEEWYKRHGFNPLTMENYEGHMNTVMERLCKTEDAE